MNLHVTAHSAAGGRSYNEDRYHVSEHGADPLLAVCDGMGGHAAGDVAAELACEVLAQSWAWSAEGVDGRPGVSLEARILDAVRAADSAIQYRSRARAECRGMGSTIVAVALAALRGTSEPRLVGVVAHVGDSRCYLIHRDGRIVQLTRDHTHAEALVDSGHIRREDILRAPTRHVLTRVLGHKSAEVERHRFVLCPGDAVLLCSDGLTDAREGRRVLSDEGIAEMVGAGATAEELVAAAVRAGSDDNVTAVLARV